MEEIKTVSLKQFIIDNHILLSALAVFATLSALLSKLSISWLSTFLSFVSIAGLILIWLEVQSQLPKERLSLKLLLFRYVMIWGLGGLILYWLLAFRDIWKVSLFIPLFFLFVYMFYSPFKLLSQILTQIINWLNSLPRFKQTKLFKKILEIKNSNNFKIFLKILRAAYLIIVIIISFNYAVLLSPPINAILDLIKNTFR
jgi:hypothetical protein